jgi:hypothetical protein
MMLTTMAVMVKGSMLERYGFAIGNDQLCVTPKFEVHMLPFLCCMYCAIEE